MRKSLLVVESPAKARTLSRYVDSSFSVVATVGHIKDLPPRELGVDIENGFKPKYSVISGKWKVIKELKSATEKVDAVYLAPDPDREGEAIAWHVADEVAKDKTTLRVLFHEITKRAVQNALQNPILLDRNKYDAQQARRILDRLVGYLISPLLWKKVRRGLSAGRVQSVAVRLICEREEEIRRFESKEYWTVHALLEGSRPPSFIATLHLIKGKKAHVPDGDKASEIKRGLEAETFRIRSIEKKSVKRNPPPPFITSTLQQEASRVHRFTPKRTMKIAQKLYEGISLGAEGPEGVITYMRTDSTRISQEAIQQVRPFVERTFGSAYLPGTPRVYPSKKKGVQDAHEAIRPTSVDREPSQLKAFLTPEQYKLYELIWKRFVACQMKPAELDQTRIDIEAGECLFRATGSVVRFDGYRRLYEETPEGDATGKAEETLLPELKEGEVLSRKEIRLEQHFTQPPSRYSESSLIKALEEKGIGRPSTYAAILSNIRERQYVDLVDRRLVPSELGELVNRLLVESFPDILNVEFTANMESSLDEIELGQKDWLKVIEAFYTAFEKDLERARNDMLDVKKEGTPTEIRCQQCGKPMVIRFSATGSFLACSGFPECKNAKSFDRDENGKIRLREEETVEDQRCPQCDRPIQIKHGRYGPFLACTGYPECRYTRPLDRPGGIPEEEGNGQEQPPCEKCGGKMVVKRARSGNRFWACSNYPRCKEAKPYRVGVPCDRCGEGEFVERAGRNGRLFYCCDRYPECKNSVPNQPVPTACEACGAPYLLSRVDKTGNPVRYCGSKECSARRRVRPKPAADSVEHEPCLQEKS
jgi:DNA topoisomerase-1